MTNKKPLIILTGPTAVGKTALSIRLAKTINAEIISADSMQVYKKMNIGTAKIKSEEMDGVTHHMIDILDPKEEFNVVMFKQIAKQLIDEITERGHIPLITGGTGFYIQALLRDIEFTEHTGDTLYREQLTDYALKHGNEALYKKLEITDPDYAAQVHSNNIKRIIRALEYHHQTGELFSIHNKREAARKSPYNYAYFVLTNERDTLYSNIDKRVDIMIKEGLVEEVKDLIDYGCTKDMISMQGLGYKEIIRYLEGEYSLDDAIEILKKETRHFAKRQLTWFKREKDTIWYDKSLLTEETIINNIIDKIKELEIK